jgi:DNA (cytosine-5)-methyltransferase 1
MGVSEDVTGALRAQEHGHQPIIFSLQGSMIGREDKNGPQGDGINEDVSFTLNATDRHAVVYGISAYDSNAMKSSNPHSGVYVADTMRTLDLNSGNPACNQGGVVVVQEALCIGNGQTNQGVSPTCGTLNCMHDSQAVIVSPDIAHTLKAKANCDYRADSETYIAQYGIARRLTPLECERLQGFPDGWTDIGDWVDSKGKRRKAADTPRYKALGNAIALPFWEWLAKRMTWQLKLSGTLNPTMGSLFDGIGGFALAFSRAGAVPVWASEIEEFAIAVTKIRFPGTERKEKT